MAMGCAPVHQTLQALSLLLDVTTDVNDYRRAATFGDRSYAALRVAGVRLGRVLAGPALFPIATGFVFCNIASCRLLSGAVRVSRKAAGAVVRKTARL